MKKSEQYRLTQIAIINNSYLSAEEKIEILKTLISDEEIELYREREAEKQAETESGSEINENSEEENE